jgi:hypothetical protein
MTNLPFDSIADAELVDGLNADAYELVTQAKPLVSIDEDNLHDASEALARCAALLKSAETMRVKMTKPLLDHKKFLDGVFKESVAPVQELSDRLRAAITKYNTQRERERRERERRALDVLAQREREREADRVKFAEAVGVPVEDIPVLDLTKSVVVEPLETEVVTASGHITARPVVKVRISNSNLVPRPWCVPDEKAITAFVKAAVKDEGVETATRTVADIFGASVTFEVEMTTVVTTD